MPIGMRYIPDASHTKLLASIRSMVSHKWLQLVHISYGQETSCPLHLEHSTLCPEKLAFPKRQIVLHSSLPSEKRPFGNGYVGCCCLILSGQNYWGDLVILNVNAVLDIRLKANHQNVRGHTIDSAVSSNACSLPSVPRS